MALKSVTVKDLIQEDTNFSLIYAKDDDTVGSILEKMKKSNISSVPVQERSKNNFSGSLDMLDLVTYCYLKFAKVSDLADESYRQMTEFVNKKVTDLTEVSGRNGFHSIPYSQPITEMLSVLASPDVHRLFVKNEAGDIIGLVSQSRIIAWLSAHKEKLPKDLMKKSVKEWIDQGKSVHRLITIQMNEFMIEAFKKIWELRVSGIAVVDDNGKLVGNVSASDLKKMHIVPIGELIHDLYQPIKSFQHIPANITDRVKYGHLYFHPICVKETDSLETVLDAIVRNRVHRVYLVDSEQVPLSVISLSDVIGAILRSLE